MTNEFSLFEGPITEVEEGGVPGKTDLIKLVINCKAVAGTVLEDKMAVMAIWYDPKEDDPIKIDDEVEVIVRKK